MFFFIIIISLCRTNNPIKICPYKPMAGTKRKPCKFFFLNIPQIQNYTCACVCLLCTNRAQASRHTSKITQLIPPYAQPNFGFSSHFPCLLGIWRINERTRNCTINSYGKWDAFIDTDKKKNCRSEVTSTSIHLLFVFLLASLSMPLRIIPHLTLSQFRELFRSHTSNQCTQKKQNITAPFQIISQ